MFVKITTVKHSNTMNICRADASHTPPWTCKINPLINNVKDQYAPCPVHCLKIVSHSSGVAARGFLAVCGGLDAVLGFRV